MFALMLLLQSAPPPPPPGLEWAVPALALLHDHPLSEPNREHERAAGRDALAREYLSAAGVDRPTDPEAFAGRLNALIDWIARNAPATEQFDGSADLCVAQNIVGSLGPPDIEEARRYFSTSIGKRFWIASRLGIRDLGSCYHVAYRGRVYGVAALQAIGVKPPAAWLGPAVD